MNYDKLSVITFSVLMEWLENFEKYSYDTGPGCSKDGYIAVSTGSKSLSIYPPFEQVGPGLRAIRCRNSKNNLTDEF